MRGRGRIEHRTDTCMANPVAAHSAAFTASIPYASNMDAAYLERLLGPLPHLKQTTNGNLQPCLQVSHTDEAALAAAIESLIVARASSTMETYAPAVGAFKRFHLPTLLPARCTRQREFYIYHGYAGGTAHLLVNASARPGDRVRACAADGGWESRALARKLSLWICNPNLNRFQRDKPASRNSTGLM